jgi:hypothetical protein
MVENVKEIILVRFHKEPQIIENRLDILKYFNPDLDIYGLFGGDDRFFDWETGNIIEKTAHVYKLDMPYKGWAWVNGDLAMMQWFDNFGKSVQFDRLYLIEWDALILGSLNDIYRRVPIDAIGLTRINYLDVIKDTWHWTLRSPYKEQWQEFMKRGVAKHDYRGRQKVSLFGLPVFPRAFFEEYSNLELETITIDGIEKPLVHDEIRLPFYAEVLGYDMVDTGFSPKKKKDEKKYFNADNNIIKKRSILKELSIKDGRRVFHPYRNILELDLIYNYLKCY